MMAFVAYFFLNLPWLTQDDNVTISALGTDRLPGLEKEYLTFRMGFTKKPIVGKTARDFFKLYIDPATYVLQGYEYSLGYGALFDAMGVPESEIFGPMLRVHDVFSEVDGLLFPTQFHTMSLDGETTYGNHVVINYSTSESFDPGKVARPVDGVVDRSSAERAQSTSSSNAAPETGEVIQLMIEAHGGMEKWQPYRSKKRGEATAGRPERREGSGRAALTRIRA